MKNKAIYTVIITTLLCIFAAGGCGGTTSGEVVTPSDYSKAENWLAIPAEHQCSADVIYFYPTAYSRTSPDIQPVVCAIDDAGMKAQLLPLTQQQLLAIVPKKTGVFAVTDKGLAQLVQRQLAAAGPKGQDVALSPNTNH